MQAGPGPGHTTSANPFLSQGTGESVGVGLTLEIPLGQSETRVRIIEAPAAPTPVLEVPEIAVMTEVLRTLAGQLSAWPGAPDPEPDPEPIGPPEPPTALAVGSWFDTLRVPTQILFGVLALAALWIYRHTIAALLMSLPFLNRLGGKPKDPKP